AVSATVVPKISTLSVRSTYLRASASRSGVISCAGWLVVDWACAKAGADTAAVSKLSDSAAAPIHMAPRSKRIIGFLPLLIPVALSPRTARSHAASALPSNVPCLSCGTVAALHSIRPADIGGRANIEEEAMLNHPRDREQRVGERFWRRNAAKRSIEDQVSAIGNQRRARRTGTQHETALGAECVHYFEQLPPGRREPEPVDLDR